MGRSEKLRKRLQEERRVSPGLSPLDLALKFNVSEGTVLGMLGGDVARRVRSDFKDKVLEEIRSWGEVTVHIHNDWAQCECECELKDASILAGLLTVRSSKVEIRIDYARVEAVFFVEFGRRPSVQFFNRRGHSIFQVLLPPGEEQGHRFKDLREALCVTTTGGRA